MRKEVKIRISTIVIIALLMIGIVVIYKNYIENENMLKFKVSDVTGSPGEEITIHIEMLEDSDFVAGNFELTYDKEKMECIHYEKGEILENGAMSIVNNDTDNGKVLIGYVAEPDEENTIQKAGNLVSITFKINEEIEDLTVNPVFSCSTLKAEDGTDIPNEIEQGIIKVQK